jgi:hypothetical protein
MHYSGVSHEFSFQSMSAISDPIAQLKNLEYEIRRSITVREDQEDAAEVQHIDAARALRIPLEADITKGDLLNAVQTQLRALRVARAGCSR